MTTASPATKSNLLGQLAREIGLIDAPLSMPTSQVESWKYSARAVKELERVAFRATPDSANAISRTEASYQDVFDELAAHADQQLLPSQLSGLHRLELIAKGIAQSTDRCVVASGDQALVLLDQLPEADHDALANRRLHIDVADHATLSLIRINRGTARQHDIAHTVINAARHATVRVIDLQIGGGFARHQLTINLQGAKAHAEVVSLMHLGGKQHADLQLSLRHLHADCTSNTTQRIMVDGRARAVFNGQIYVAAGSDRTDAKLKTSSLMLSEHAEVNAKPELEIHADDVQCAHGATIGRLDEQALFYLRARGIEVEHARAMLSLAFAASAIESLAEDQCFDAAIKAELLAHIRQRFAVQD
jgi:Fe-S cluster assembly protein SufD